MTIGIIGNGAIGNILAMRLNAQQVPFCLLTRDGQPLSLMVTDGAGDIHHFTPEVRTIEQPGDLQQLIVPVKAYQVLPALQQIKPKLSPHCVITLLHNGMGTIEQVKQLLPNQPVIAATTSYGAFKPDAGHCIETGKGETHAGWVSGSEQVHGNNQSLAAGFPPCHWHADIQQPLWRKLAINAAINPLTAINDICNGELARPCFGELLDTICAEVAAVMTASGHPAQQNELRGLVDKVIKATANNYSSMHQDVKHRRRTEIDFINGYVVQQARTLAIDVPLNQTLIEDIKGLYG